MGFTITLDKAERLIDAYRTHFIDTGKMPNKIGGTLRKNHIKLLRDSWESSRLNQIKGIAEINSIRDVDSITHMELNEGLANWCCWKQGNTMADSEFFLAFEFTDGIVVDYDGMQFPDNRLLARPFEIVKNEANRPIDELLSKKTGFEGETKPETIKRGHRLDEDDSVLKACDSFAHNGPKQPSGVPYNLLPFGLFENIESTDVNVFLAKIPANGYIRYYLGYEPNLVINKIRVILIGVDDKGNNLLPGRGKSAEEILRNEEPSILQTSWPPKRD